MGSGNNSTPVISGLLRRRYSVPEIIMRKHSLAQQKVYDESLAATAPSPYRSPAAPVYQKSYSTNTPARSYPSYSSGSDSNLSLRPGGEMSMRKSTLLRRIWNRDLKRYDDTRSGSWSPPMRRSQRRLHPEPVESHRCEECRKFEDEHSDESEELVVSGSSKRLRLISMHAKEAANRLSSSSIVSYHSSSANYTESTSEQLRLAAMDNNSLESTPSSSMATETATTTTTTASSLNSKTNNNVHIYMTPIQPDRTSSEPIDQGQDMLRVEIDLDNGETNGNNIETTSDENQNQPETVTTSGKLSTNGSGDSPLDKFISKLLIDNLADLADEINEQYENNNNLMRNTSTPKSKKISVVYLTSEPRNLSLQLTSNSVGSGLQDAESNDLSAKADPSDNEHVIYFPSYSLECKDDMSSYTSNCSDFDLSSIPAESLVTVSAGSIYPLNSHTTTLVVPRMLHKFPRTESLEAQHSLASGVGEEHDDADVNGNDTDDSISLVDSLDEPPSSINNNGISTNEKTDEAGDENKTEPPRECEQEDVENEEEDEVSPPVCREPEAFFVPIVGSDVMKSEKRSSVAEAMPAKLKEKIMQRQRELDKKKIEEHRKKQRKMEELMDPKLAEEGFVEKSPMRMKKDSPVKEKPAVPKKSENLVRKLQTKSNAVILRGEVGLLESYTIDSKGNMQMRAPQPKTESSSAGNQSSSGAIKKLNSSRPSIQRKQSMIAPKPPEIHIQDKKTSTSSTSSHSRTKHHIRKDVQKMTIFQAQSDIITPDSENGPRRVYQKTEIQDGEKCIEILEIVECIETSPECSPGRQHTYRCSKSARRSKIPIPIYKMGRASGYQKAIRCPILREASPNSVKCLSRNLQTNASNKVDRVIAELLIDALNRPDEMGIEIVKMPKDLTRDKTSASSTSSSASSSKRRNTPRRSANNTKYQQIFEMIPEEKSSFSVDSSAEETTKSGSAKARTRDSSSTQVKMSSSTAATKELRELSTETSSTVATTLSSASQKSSVSNNSGRLAVDHAEPNAWIGFFRRHNDSSMDEDDSPSQPYPNSTTSTSHQPTISSPSTNTAAAGSTTPKDLSSANCINSAESDNVLPLIDETFQENKTKSKTKPTIPPKPTSISDYGPKSTATETPVTNGTLSTATSETFSNTCNSCKKIENQRKLARNKSVGKNSTPEDSSTTSQVNAIKKSDTVVKIELKESLSSSSTSSGSSSAVTAEASSGSNGSHKRDRKTATSTAAHPDVWRVQSPDICKMAIPRLKQKERSKSEEDSASFELMTAIDSKSFIIVEESCNMSPSGLNCSANIPTAISTAATSTNPYAPFESNKCTICCFCNPDLHKSNKSTSSTPCPYCNRRRTPPRREEETNTESDYFLNHPFYHSMTKSDHTHIRTRSRDSDIISTKCTRVNEKIKNYNIPEPAASSTSRQDNATKPKTRTSTKNLSRPKNVVNLPPANRTEPATVHRTIIQDSVKSREPISKNASPERKALRLPSPYTNLSSTSFERTTSPSSSSDSTCPTTPSRCPPVLPSSSSRRHQFGNSKDKERRRERKADGKVVTPTGPAAGAANNNDSVSDNANNNSGSSNGKMNGQSNGWSVTVAGSYNQNMAPDLEMRLSFPKSGGNSSTSIQQHPPTSQPIASNNPITQIMPQRRDGHYQQRSIINGNSLQYQESHYEDDDMTNENYTRNNNHHQHHQYQALPPAINPKRTLTRIVSERTHSQRDINFPEVSPVSRNPIASREMAKKAIKHTECSVAVSSATRTISNFARGRRTYSYQSLNTTETKRTNPSTNHNNNNTHHDHNPRDRHSVRDNSLDLGNLSSGRRMSLESPAPSVDGCLALSIMGNAIAPEQKPRVLTMSEKDLTRRHHSCFTRNRAFFA